MLLRKNGRITSRSDSATWKAAERALGAEGRSRLAHCIIQGCQKRIVRAERYSAASVSSYLEHLGVGTSRGRPVGLFAWVHRGTEDLERESRPPQTAQDEPAVKWFQSYPPPLSGTKLKPID